MRTISFCCVGDARGAVGGVTLGGDALVPVVIGGGGVLDLDGFEPGIFAGRLVEVAVDADVARASGGGRRWGLRSFAVVRDFAMSGGRDSSANSSVRVSWRKRSALQRSYEYDSFGAAGFACAEGAIPDAT